MTSSTDRSRRLRAGALSALTALILVACGGDSPINPPPQTTTCKGVSTAVRAPAALEGVVLSAADAACFALAGNDREYLVIPQLTGASLPYGGYGFRLGDPSTITATLGTTPDAVAASVQGAPDEPAPDAQQLLDARMRSREAQWVARGTARPTRPLLSIGGAGAAIDTIRTFSVLNTLAETPAYSAVGARLRYAGSKVLIYVDTLAASAFTDAELSGMGTLYDTRLIPAVNATFGDGSDIDGNGRVIFLLTPTVNAMVTATACSVSGYVRGFFYNHDLGSTDATSNKGEIFYAFVPDETARWSCAHPKSDVMANVPPTFIHELQHMVSFGEHAIERGGTAEETWLNEGLSHMAEEMGSLSYEARFPAPAGRTVPTQLFPDSAAPYISPNLLYSYRYLFSSGAYSLTSCAPGSFCSLSERGGIWLFLRYLADRDGNAIFKRLVETRSTGRANLEAVTGRSAAAMIGEYVMAVSADSLVGVPRASVPATLRFSSRNLRKLYKGLYDAYGILGGVGRAFPLEPLTLSPGATITGTMRPSTFLTYRIKVTAPSAVLQLLAADGSAFPLSSGAQVSILRLP